MWSAPEKGKGKRLGKRKTNRIVGGSSKKLRFLTTMLPELVVILPELKRWKDLYAQLVAQLRGLCWRVISDLGRYIRTHMIGARVEERMRDSNGKI